MQTRDYTRLSREESIKALLWGVVVLGLVGYLFYQSIIGMLLMQILLLPYFKRYKQERYIKRLWEINQEFKEFLLSLSAALHAGYSIENALIESREGLSHLLGEQADMMRELEYMISQMQLNMSVEEIFLKLEERLPIEDVHNFVDVFGTAKRTGGDIIRIIHSTSGCIRDKVEVKREIQTLVTAKKFEGKIMCLAPMGIILYLQMGSPDYLSPLYHNLIGIIVMTALLAVYGLAYIMTTRIMTIEV